MKRNHERLDDQTDELNQASNRPPKRGSSTHNERAGPAQRWASKKMLAGAAAPQLPARIQIQHFPARAPDAGERLRVEKCL